MSFAGGIRRLHIWAGIILAVQVVLWMASGVIMTWFAIDTVRGEHLTSHHVRQELPAQTFVAPGGLIARTDGALSVTLREFRARPVYEVETLSERILFDAQSGEQLSPLPEEIARELAERDYIGDGEITNLQLMSETPPEYRGALPVWRAEFDDGIKTRLYISPQTGEIVSRRNQIWRIFDFFWMLHIMDYDERDNICLLYTSPSPRDS